MAHKVPFRTELKYAEGAKRVKRIPWLGRFGLFWLVLKVDPAIRFSRRLELQMGLIRKGLGRILITGEPIRFPPQRASWKSQAGGSGLDGELLRLTQGKGVGIRTTILIGSSLSRRLDLIFALRAKDLGEILIAAVAIRVAIVVCACINRRLTGGPIKKVIGEMAKGAWPATAGKLGWGGQDWADPTGRASSNRGTPIRSGDLIAEWDIPSGAGTNSSGRSSGILRVPRPGAHRADFYFLLGIPSRIREAKRPPSAKEAKGALRKRSAAVRKRAQVHREEGRHK